MDLSSQRINDVHQFYSVKHSSAQHKGRYIIRPQFLTSIGEQRRLGFCPRLSLRMVSRNLCIRRKKGGSRMFRDHIPPHLLCPSSCGRHRTFICCAIHRPRDLFPRMFAAGCGYSADHTFSIARPCGVYLIFTFPSVAYVHFAICVDRDTFAPNALSCRGI